MNSLLVLLLAVLVVLLVALIFLLYQTCGPRKSKAKDQKDHDQKKSYSISSSLSPELGYDIFLSFTGNETRTNFVDPLYQALTEKGFCAFMAEEQSKDEKEVFKVIEKSKFAIVILSMNYVSSTRCMDQLVKIIECKEDGKQIVMPIFYQVDKSKVRNEKVFAKQNKNRSQPLNRIPKWTEALKVLTNMAGINLKESMDSQVILEIVRWILKELKYDFLTRKIELVGADSHVDKVKSYLDLESNDSLVVGIWGMGGIGKTAIAKRVFANIRDQFEAYSFVPNMANYTVVQLQKILIRSLFDSDADIETEYEGISMLVHKLHLKKVLIVLDDVVSIEQLECLFGKSDELGYFGPKSRIIITTRDKHLLCIYAAKNRYLQVEKVNVDSDERYIYTINKLNDKESLQLLCLKAFGQHHPPNDFKDLCDKVVVYAEGLPLALEVFGSFLHGRSKEVWSDALSVLEKELKKEIFVSLRISYDGLTTVEKNLFLDIACFFVGKDQIQVNKILEACGFQPMIGISVLVEKSLVRVEENALLMHGLIKQMAWEIVREESLREPNKRVRLLHHEDIYDTLKRKKGIEAVESIQILRKPEDLNADAFSKMSNLKLLKLHNAGISGLPSLPNNLRFLEWHDYPLNKLTLPNNLVEVCLCNSSIEELQIASLSLKELLVLDLSNCRYMTKTPNFEMFPNLEKLIFEGCRKLLQVDPSIKTLQNLSQLNLKDCNKLSSLPNEIWSMTSLRTLNLSGCLNLPPLPKHNLDLKLLKIILPSSTKVAEVDSNRLRRRTMHKAQASS